MAANNQSRPFILRAFSSFWRFVTWLRICTFNLLFLFLLLVVLGVVFAPKEPPLPAKAPLLIAPSGVLVDQFSYRPATALLLEGGSAGNAETRVSDLVEVIDYAQHDDRVTALLLQLDFLEGGGVSKMREIGAAIQRFKASGKPVIAYADDYSQQQYFLATYANEIYLHDLGNVLLTGFGLYRNYFEEALNKIGAEFHIFKAGTFKDFVEPYTRNSMSDASREHNRRWLEEMWQVFVQQVESERGLDAGELEAFISQMPRFLEQSGGDASKALLDLGLVDHVSSRIERNAAFAERFGTDDEDREFLHIHYNDYSGRVLGEDPLDEQAQIGLIVASGTILDGFQPDGTIGGDSMSALIRQARQDESIKALVIRIDSGGGSAFASEIIRQELEATRAAGKPVVVSMGSIAASGGYWMAMAADEVWATPTTLTGSIGVFGIFPTFDGSLAKLGIHTDGIGTTALAGGMRPDMPLSPLAQNIIQKGVEDIYGRFVGLVANSREMSPEAVHQVAEGRVWTGNRAHALGLVDKLGYLQDAVQSAAEMADLSSSRVKLIERQLSPQEQLIKQLTGSAASVAQTVSLKAYWGEWFAPGLSALEKLLGHNPLRVDGKAPQHAYALCLDCVGI